MALNRNLPLPRATVGASKPAAIRRCGSRPGSTRTIVTVAGTTIELRMPRDPRARTVADQVLRTPADQRSLKAWAAGAATSERTLRRLFLAETGISFGQWQRQARLQATLPLLAAGASTATVARRAGYATPSAFVAAFRRTLGIAPGAYAGLAP